MPERGETLLKTTKTRKQDILLSLVIGSVFTSSDGQSQSQVVSIRLCTIHSTYATFWRVI